MRPLRLLIVSSTFPEFKAGGVPRYVEGRCCYLSRRLDVRIAARGPSRGHVERKSLASLPGLLGMVVAWFKLVWFTILWRPHFIEVHNIPVGLPLLLLGKVRYVFHGPAGLEARAQGRHPWRVAFASLIEAICLRRADSLHCVSPYFMALLREKVLNGYKCSHARRVIQPRLEFDLPLPTVKAPDKTLLVCRRLVPRTGVDLAIRAFSIVANDSSLPPSRLLVIGEGPQRAELQELASSLPMGSCSVHFAGSVSNEIRDSAYAAAIAQVVPTKSFEGFGLVVVEAALFGCPSIVTRVDALPWVIGELDGIGTVVEPTVASLADAIRENLLRPTPLDRRKQLQQRAARRFGVKRKVVL